MSPFTTQKMAKPMMRKLMMALMKQTEVQRGSGSMLRVGKRAVMLVVEGDGLFLTGGRRECATDLLVIDGYR